MDCYFVLKTVDDLECSPVSYEDCKEEVVDEPYLAEEEQCQDVEFEECEFMKEGREGATVAEEFELVLEVLREPGKIATRQI